MKVLLLSLINMSADGRQERAHVLLKLRVVSSVGLEHYLDRVGVTGSNPVQPTKFSQNVYALHSPDGE